MIDGVCNMGYKLGIFVFVRLRPARFPELAEEGLRRTEHTVFVIELGYRPCPAGSEESIALDFSVKLCEDLVLKFTNSTHKQCRGKHILVKIPVKLALNCIFMLN